MRRITGVEFCEQPASRNEIERAANEHRLKLKNTRLERQQLLKLRSGTEIGKFRVFE